jgi:hypothetical protein
MALMAGASGMLLVDKGINVPAHVPSADYMNAMASICGPSTPYTPKSPPAPSEKEHIVRRLTQVIEERFKNVPKRPALTQEMRRFGRSSDMSSVVLSSVATAQQHAIDTLKVEIEICGGEQNADQLLARVLLWGDVMTNVLSTVRQESFPDAAGIGVAAKMVAELNYWEWDKVQPALRHLQTMALNYERGRFVSEIELEWYRACTGNSRQVHALQIMQQYVDGVAAGKRNVHLVQIMMAELMYKTFSVAGLHDSVLSHVSDLSWKQLKADIHTRGRPVSGENLDPSVKQ